jgi:hypothetical protein
MSCAIAASRGLVLIMLLLAACRDRNAASPHTGSADHASDDSAFAMMQARGGLAMGVDQYTSTHRFEPLPDGGLITLVRSRDDSAGVIQIRAHMRAIAAAFQRGDFNLPGFVHARPVPGTATMGARRSRISYLADTVPGGGSLRIRSSDSIAVAAIHDFLAFQRSDHRVDAGTSH